MAFGIKCFFLVFLNICFFVAPLQAGSASRQNAPQPAPIVVGQTMTGISAWYGLRAHGKGTTSGKTFDSTKLTAAHRTLPFGTMVKVTNTKNKKYVVVEITDRGPSSKKFVIDISRQAAITIGMLKQGTAKVVLEVLSLPPTYARKKASK